MAEQLVPVDGAPIAAWVSGVSSEPVALVHGSFVDHTTFDRLAVVLDRSLRVLRYDRRGYGASPPVAERYALASDARDLAALLETLDLHPAHLVGHSFGAIVALELGLERPELVRGLVLHEPPLYGLLASDAPGLAEAREASEGAMRLVAAGEPRAAARRFIEEIGMGSGDWDRLGPAVQAVLARHAPRALAEFESGAMFRADLERLRGLDLPVLVTSGSSTRPLFASIADRLAAELPNARRRVLEGTGHVPQLTEPALFGGAILEFLLDRVIPIS